VIGGEEKVLSVYRSSSCKVGSHDRAIVGVLKAIRELMHPPLPRKRPIGFMANLDE